MIHDTSGRKLHTQNIGDLTTAMKPSSKRMGKAVARIRQEKKPIADATMSRSREDKFILEAKETWQTEQSRTEWSVCQR